MLEPDLVATLHRLACPARLFLHLSLSHGEQRCLIVIGERLHGDDLLARAAAVVRIDRGEEHFARRVLQADA